MIKAVFFDFYETLVRWTPAAEAIQARACAEEGLEVSEEALAQAYPAANAYMAQENFRQPLAQRPEAPRGAFFAEYERRLLEAAGLKVGLEKAQGVWERVHRAPKKLAPYDDALPSLQELREASFKTGVISNMGPELAQVIEDLGLESLIDVRCSSYETGVSKPDPRIFQAALAQAGVSPKEAMFVGDDYSGDIVGAQNAGMHALLVARAGRQGVPQGCPTVTTLRGVLPHLLDSSHLAAD